MQSGHKESLLLRCVFEFAYSSGLDLWLWSERVSDKLFLWMKAGTSSEVTTYQVSIMAVGSFESLGFEVTSAASIGAR